MDAINRIGCYILILAILGRIVALPQDTSSGEQLQACGDAYYLSSMYTCYDDHFLCPVLNGEPSLRCGPSCYFPSMYSCSGGELIYPPTSSASASPSASSNASTGHTCSQTPSALHLSAPPYENYFYSDCHSANQVVVTTPLPNSNLSIIGPRLLVAWPAGNSGVVAFFEPQNGINGTLAIELVGEGSGSPISPIYKQPSSDSMAGSPVVGISTKVRFNSTAVLNVPILGSIRTIRDFTEGPSILVPVIQSAINFTKEQSTGVLLSRLWLDNKTITQMSFVPLESGSTVTIHGNKTVLDAGTYEFNATFDYPQLTQLSAREVLNAESQDLIAQQPDQTTSLSFLSYSEKLVAGAWRFLTYFGRDTMISLLLMQPVLSEGEGGAIEAVISAVLERINKTDGFVCHEETIGDYATYQHLLLNQTSTAPLCSYIMIDTNYYLAPVMQNYFLNTETGRKRKDAFFATKAKIDFGDQGMTYRELALRNAQHVMRSSAAFAAPGGQQKKNLIHLEKDQIVGEWRDSTYGIGGGRIPYDVNTGLVPAALNSISALSNAGFFPEHPEWKSTAGEYARVWEDETLQFFEVTVPEAEAKSLLQSYVDKVGDGFPSEASSITSDVVFHGLALNGYNDTAIVKVMNTDDCFRMYLLNTTNQAQLTGFINQTANNIQTPFPAGLSTPVGVLVANPAYGQKSVYAANWTNNAYHGTVVWSWPMAMLAAGLERQLGRCSSSSPPDFCADTSVHSNVLAAYNHLWDLIDKNKPNLSTEVWSWQYKDGEFQFIEFGALPPPAGQNPTESDIRQLWSLTFLSMTRNESLK